MSSSLNRHRTASSPRLGICRHNSQPEAVKRNRLMQTMIGVAFLGGVFVHEAGHWLGAKYLTSLRPVQLRLYSSFAKTQFAGSDGTCGEALNLSRCLLSILTADGGVVWYAGSAEDHTGYVWPNPHGAHVFDRDLGGWNEGISAFCGPFAQVLWALLLTALVYIYGYDVAFSQDHRPHSWWWLFLEFVPLYFLAVAAGTNLLVGIINFLPLHRGVDGWDVRQAWRVWRRS